MLLELNLTRGIRKTPWWREHRSWEVGDGGNLGLRRWFGHMCVQRWGTSGTVVNAAYAWLQKPPSNCKHWNCPCQGRQNATLPSLRLILRLGLTWPISSIWHRSLLSSLKHCLHLISRIQSRLVLHLPVWPLLLSLCCLISPLIFPHQSTPGPALPSSLPNVSTFTLSTLHTHSWHDLILSHDFKCHPMLITLRYKILSLFCFSELKTCLSSCHQTHTPHVGGS